MGRYVIPDLDPSFIDLLSIVQQLPCFVSMLDRSRKVVWVNQFAFGHNPELSLGKRNENFIHEEDRDNYIHAIRIALDTGMVTQGTIRIMMPDSGPLMRMLFRVGPYRFQEKIIGALAICWDITFHKQTPSLTQFLLTARSRKVVEFLHQSGPSKGVVIGKQLGELSSDKKQASSKLRICLSSLEERKIIRNSIDGYELTEEFLEAYLSTL